MITLQNFLKLEINEIEKFKNYENKKAGYDLGVNTEIKWVDNNAIQFRNNIIKKYGSII